MNKKIRNFFGGIGILGLIGVGATYFWNSPREYSAEVLEVGKIWSEKPRFIDHYYVRMNVNLEEESFQNKILNRRGEVVSRKVLELYLGNYPVDVREGDKIKFRISGNYSFDEDNRVKLLNDLLQGYLVR